MRLAVIKYNAGNTQSVVFALERLGIDFIVTENLEEIQSADKILFPGVGEASSTMSFLKSKKLDTLIPRLKQPFLGICLGMQLMCRHSDENDTKCLGIFEVDVKKFQFQTDFKVPHTGWNTLTKVKSWIDTSLENEFVYFVHSYYAPVNVFTTAETEYIVPFSAAMEKDNFKAVQFHPEKSASAGEKILTSFLNS